MHAVEDERQYRRLVAGGADEPHARDGRQQLGSVSEELVLIVSDLFEAEPRDVLEAGG
jgi:hypothetical protein